MVCSALLFSVVIVADDDKPAIQTKYPISFYGFLKFDASYDTARVNPGNFPRWVESESTNDGDDQFNATANQSRFGLNFNGPDLGSYKVSGKLEIDFYGGGPENKANPMMRQAYLKLDWPNSDFSILAGQTLDVVSPLLPSMVNYTVGWWVGNPGYRRPQLRISKGFSAGGGAKLLLQAAAVRTIGDATPFSPGDTGEDAGFPTFQGRLALSFPAGGRTATIGVSGHWGQEEFDFDSEGNNEGIDTQSLNVDVTIPLSTHLTLTGEYWAGENMDAYLAGIGQGVNKITLEAIYSTGGWASLGYSKDNWSFNLGAGIDDPDNDDLEGGSRSLNSAIWFNFFYRLQKAVSFAMEFSNWNTEYINKSGGDAFRVQMAMIYSF